MGPGQFTRRAEGQTNSDGLFEMPLTRAQNSLPSNVDTVAWVGDQYAVSARFWSGLSYPQGDFKLYSYTDRPLYRPSQTVHFRQLRARPNGGRTIPAAGEEGVGTWADPRGQTLRASTWVSRSFDAAPGQCTPP